MLRKLRHVFPLLLVLSTCALAQDAHDEAVKSLRGLSGVHVEVEDLHDNARAVGLTEDKIRADVELSLRRAGVTVLSRDEALNQSGAPYLYVNVNTVPKGRSYGFSMSVEFVQVIKLDRDPSISLFATTWSKASVGVVRAKKSATIRKNLSGLVKVFLDDYLTANPK
jgi:hypothetical protein